MHFHRGLRHTFRWQRTYERERESESESEREIPQFENRERDAI